MTPVLRIVTTCLGCLLACALTACESQDKGRASQAFKTTSSHYSGHPFHRHEAVHFHFILKQQDA